MTTDQTTLTPARIAQRMSVATNILEGKFRWQITAASVPVPSPSWEKDRRVWEPAHDGATVMDYVMNPQWEFRALRDPGEMVTKPLRVENIPEGACLKNRDGDWFTIFRTDKANSSLLLCTGTITADQLYEDGWSYYGSDYEEGEVMTWHDCSAKQREYTGRLMEAYDSSRPIFDWKRIDPQPAERSSPA